MIPSLKFIHVFIDELSVFYDRPKKENVEKLYELFGDTPEPVLKRAVKILISKHKFKSFPLPVVILNAIEEARMERTRDSIEPDLPQEDCDKCYNQGIRLVDRYDDFYGRIKPIAVPCDCAKGKRINRGWRTYDSDSYNHHTRRKSVKNIEAL